MFEWITLNKSLTQYPAYDHTSYNMRIWLPRFKRMFHFAFHTKLGPQYKGFEIRVHKNRTGTLDEAFSPDYKDPLAERRKYGAKPLEVKDR